MAAPTTGACEVWVDFEDLECDADLTNGPLPEATLQSLIVNAATNALYERSCRQFGLCEVTARPVPCCKHLRWPCLCGRYDAIQLGTQPVAEVTEVLIDGDILATSAYRVDEWSLLVRTDGSNWPRCNDLSLAATEDGTLEVTWTYGLEVPPEGLLAAALLACHYAHQIAEACKVPDNASSIAREGVTIQLAPPKPGESLGVKFVDEWLAQFHCGGAIFDPGARDMHEIVRVNT